MPKKKDHLLDVEYVLWDVSSRCDPNHPDSIKKENQRMKNQDQQWSASHFPPRVTRAFIQCVIA